MDVPPGRPRYFAGLDDELIEILNVWARFIYGPLMDDRVRAIAQPRSCHVHDPRA